MMLMSCCMFVLAPASNHTTSMPQPMLCATPGTRYLGPSPFLRTTHILSHSRFSARPHCSLYTPKHFPAHSPFYPRVPPNPRSSHLVPNQHITVYKPHTPFLSSRSRLSSATSAARLTRAASCQRRCVGRQRDCCLAVCVLEYMVAEVMVGGRIRAR